MSTSAPATVGVVGSDEIARALSAAGFKVVTSTDGFSAAATSVTNELRTSQVDAVIVLDSDQAIEGSHLWLRNTAKRVATAVLRSGAPSKNLPAQEEALELDVSTSLPDVLRRLGVEAPGAAAPVDAAGSMLQAAPREAIVPTAPPTAGQGFAEPNPVGPSTSTAVDDAKNQRPVPATVDDRISAVSPGIASPPHGVGPSSLSGSTADAVTSSVAEPRPPARTEAGASENWWESADPQSQGYSSPLSDVSLPAWASSAPSAPETEPQPLPRRRDIRAASEQAPVAEASQPAAAGGFDSSLAQFSAASFVGDAEQHQPQPEQPFLRAVTPPSAPTPEPAHPVAEQQPSYLAPAPVSAPSPDPAPVNYPTAQADYSQQVAQAPQPAPHEPQYDWAAQQHEPQQPHVPATWESNGGTEVPTEQLAYYDQQMQAAAAENHQAQPAPQYAEQTPAYPQDQYEHAYGQVAAATAAPSPAEPYQPYQYEQQQQQQQQQSGGYFGHEQPVQHDQYGYGSPQQPQAHEWAHAQAPAPSPAPAEDAYEQQYTPSQWGTQPAPAAPLPQQTPDHLSQFTAGAEGDWGRQHTTADEQVPAQPFGSPVPPVQERPHSTVAEHQAFPQAAPEQPQPAQDYSSYYQPPAQQYAAEPVNAQPTQSAQATAGYEAQWAGQHQQPAAPYAPSAPEAPQSQPERPAWAPLPKTESAPEPAEPRVPQTSQQHVPTQHANATSVMDALSSTAAPAGFQNAARAPNNRPQQKLARVVVPVAAKGGVGKSTLALSLAQRAVSAGPEGYRVVLVDANRGQGDLRTFLRLPEGSVPTIYDAAVSGNPQDAIVRPEKINAVRGSGWGDIGFAFVAAPPRESADPQVVSAQVYRGVIDYIRTIADLVIIDTQISEAFDTSGLFRQVLVPLLAADGYALGMADMSVPGVSNLVDQLKSYTAEEGVPAERILLALNGATDADKQSLSTLSNYLSTTGTFTGSIPYDVSIRNDMNVGRPVGDKDSLVPVVDAVLHAATGVPMFAGASPRSSTNSSKPEKKSGGLLGRFRK